MGRTWKETVIFELKAASRNLVAATEECHGKNNLRLPDSEARLEVGTFRVPNIYAKEIRNVPKLNTVPRSDLCVMFCLNYS